MIFDSVRGLVREAERLERAFRRFNPDLVALAISRSELGALLSRDDLSPLQMSTYDAVYAAHLSMYGQVRLPPPELRMACDLAITNGVPLRTVDMSDDRYADALLRNVSPWDLIMQSLRVRGLVHRRLKAKSAREFAVLWDRKVNRSGFRHLESMREDFIARRVAHLADRYRRILAVVEAQRAEGVTRRLIALLTPDMAGKDFNKRSGSECRRDDLDA